MRKFQKNNSGPIRLLRPGFTITLKDALILMIIVSDCTCTGHIVDLIGVNRINYYCKSIGLVNTKIKKGFPPLGKESLHKYMDITSPKDIANLLKLILKGSKKIRDARKIGCTPKLCKLALNILNKQELNTRLPLLLPDKAKAAHKTGTRKGVTNDAGIIYFKNKPLFIITVFTKNKINSPTQRSSINLFTAKLCKYCFNSFLKYKYKQS